MFSVVKLIVFYSSKIKIPIPSHTVSACAGSTKLQGLKLGIPGRRKDILEYVSEHRRALWAPQPHFPKLIPKEVSNV